MFVVHAHPSLYQQRPRRVFNPFELALEQLQYSFVAQPALVDPVDLARARYLHALEEEQAAREVYAGHHLRVFQDEVATHLLQQQRQRQQALVAREEARQRAVHVRRQQIIQARREEEFRRRRQEREENEFAQALVLAFELANQVQPPPIEAPVRPHCARAHATPILIAKPARAAAPRPVPDVSSVPVFAPPPRPTPAPQPRVRFSPPQTAPPVSSIPVTWPAARPVPLQPVLKPAAPPATSSTSVRIPIRESTGKASSHVRINFDAAATQPVLSPADAIAALTMLEANLDALIPAATAAPLLKHQLNSILESVDSIESGGHAAVRDVRRALVQRIEDALVRVERGEVAFADPQRAPGVTINEPASTSVEVKVPEPVAVEPVSVPIVAHEPVAPQPSVEDDFVDVVASAVEPEAVSAPATAIEGYAIDDLLVPDAPAPAVSEPVVPQHNELAPGVTAEDMLDGVALARLESSASPAPLAAEFDTSLAVDESSSPGVAADELGHAPVDEAGSPVHPAVAAADSTPGEAASTHGPTTTLSAVDGNKARATPDEPRSVPSASSRTPSPALPEGTPLAASYPPAQTFAALTHPPVDAGSDGEWERTSGSEGEKSDYEVV